MRSKTGQAVSSWMKQCAGAHDKVQLQLCLSSGPCVQVPRKYVSRIWEKVVRSHSDVTVDAMRALGSHEEIPKLEPAHKLAKTSVS